MRNADTKSIGVSKKRWVVCFENTILDLDLSIYEKMVYIVLCSHAKKDGPAFPSVKTIAREASCSRTKVFEALNKLEEMGVISRSQRVFGGRGQTSNLYEINDIEPRPQSGQGGGENSPSPSAGRIEESATRTEASAARTGGVRHADGHIKVLEQDYMNKTKEQNSPPSPPGGCRGEGAAFLGDQKNQSQSQGQEQNQNQGQNHDTERNTKETKISEGDFFEKIRDAYNTALPELPEAGRITSSRAGTLKKRMEEDFERRKLSWWKQFFARVKKYPWPMGDNPNNWRADFDWLIGERGMQKIIEGSFGSSSVSSPAPHIWEGTKAGWELQNKYTDAGGLVNVSALLRNL